MKKCPYCNAIYYYRDVRKNKNKVIQCYHCKKSFVRSKKGYLLLGAIVLAVTVLINIAFISLFSNITESILPIFIISIAAVIIAYFLTPYFVKYKKYRKED